MRYSQLVQCIEAQFKQSNLVNYLLLGQPGAGKSALARDIGRRLGFDRVEEFNASLRDPVDLLGTPNNHGDVTRWVKPADLAKLETGRNLLIVEEITDCNMMMQNALCRLIYDRQVGELKLSDETYVIACGNRTEDKSGANRLSTKLSNRMRIHTFEVNLDDWVEWALTSGNIDPVLIQFLRFKPKLLSDFKPDAVHGINPTPRAWESINRIPKDLPNDLYFQECSGTVGEGAAAEFTAFRKIYHALISFEEIVLHPKKAKVPEELSAKYAIVGSLAHNANVGNIDRVAEYVERLPKDFGVMFWMDARKKTPELKATKPFMQWATSNANVIFN
jgi:hypothetical protein